MRSSALLGAVLLLAACKSTPPLPPDEACASDCVHIQSCFGISADAGGATDADAADGGTADFYGTCIARCNARTAHYAAMSAACENDWASFNTCNGEEATPCTQVVATTLHPTDRCYSRAKALQDRCGPPPP